MCLPYNTFQTVKHGGGNIMVQGYKSLYSKVPLKDYYFNTEATKVKIWINVFSSQKMMKK